jgi:hypothetical protein
MTTATYSAVLDHPVETVWSLIRDFNNYPAYIDGVTESEWSVAIDAAPGQADSWRILLLSLIPVWTGSLKAALARNSL